jgi:hypothetical protein
MNARASRDASKYVFVAPECSPNMCRFYWTHKHNNYARSEQENSKTWMIQGMRWLESTYNEGKVVLHIHISNSAERVAK